MQFAEKLKKLMNSKKISSYGLAKSLGVSRSSLSNWVSGKTKPNPNYIRQIANYFSVTEECLLDDTYDGIINIVKAKEQPLQQTEVNYSEKVYNIIQGESSSKELQRLIAIYYELNEDDRTILMGEALKLQKAANKQEYITEVVARGNSKQEVKIKKSDMEKDLENYTPPDEL